MFCTQCGSNNRQGTTFCVCCGTRLSSRPFSAQNSSTGTSYSSGGFGANRPAGRAGHMAYQQPAAPQKHRGHGKVAAVLVGLAAALALVLFAGGQGLGIAQGGFDEAFGVQAMSVTQTTVVESETEEVEEEDDYSYWKVDDFALDDDLANVDGAALSWEAWTGDDLGYWHAHVSDYQRSIYDEFFGHMIEGETEFHVWCADYWTDDVRIALWALENDHPEIFWWDSGVNYTYWNASGYGLEISLQTLYSAEERDAVQEQMNASIEEFAATVTDDMADWQKALAAYEWLGRNVDYDYGHTIGERDQSAASALVDRRSVCEGYGKAYSLLLRRVGVPSTYVTGEAYNAKSDDRYDPDGDGWENHGWNIVCLCGRMGYSDATWGDIADSKDWPWKPLSTDPENLPKQFGYDYDYFFMTTDELADQDHRVSVDAEDDGWQVELLPECGADIGSIQEVEIRAER